MHLFLTQQALNSRTWTQICGIWNLHYKRFFVCWLSIDNCKYYVEVLVWMEYVIHEAVK